MNDHEKTKSELIDELNSLRARMEKAESHDRSCCDTLIDGLPLIIFEFDPQERFTYVNAYGLNVFGYAQQDIQHLTIKDVLLPEDYPRAKGVLPKLVAGEIPTGNEYTAVRKDGSQFPIRLFTQRLMEDGELIGFRGMVVDISDVQFSELALQRSENYFKSLFSNTGTAMASYREDGILRTCNTQFEKLCGYSSEELLGKMRWTEFVDKADLVWMLRYHNQRLDGNNTAPSDYEFTFVSRDGSRKRVRLFIQVIPGTSDRVCSLIDITASEKDKEALKRSEERYELVVRGANDGIWDWNLETGEIYYSPRYLAMIGYEADEFEGKIESWQALIHPDDYEYVMSANQACIDGQVDHFEITYRLRHKDGTYRWVHARGAGSKDVTGHVHRLAGTHTDITSRKLTEEALRASEERYELVVRGANDGIWDWDIETNEVYFSPRYKAMLGYEDHEFPNVAESWIQSIHPDDKEHCLAANTECLEGRTDHFEVEYRLRHKDGSYRWILGRGASVKDADGDVHRIAGTHTDITERKLTEEALRASEERYGLVVRGANDGIWDWNIDTDEVYYSPRYKAILGYEDNEFPNNAESWMNAIHPDDKDLCLAANMECVEGRVDHFQIEYRLQHKDGSYRWILGRGASVRDSEGKVHRVAGTHTDITERKAVEEALKESEERFREIFEYASNGIYQCTIPGQFLTVNRALSNLLGYKTPEEMTSSMRMGSKGLWVDPKARDVFLEKLCKHGSLEGYEQHLRKKDGTEIWVSENVRVVKDENGDILYYEGFIQDITERKQHERTSQALYAISRAVSTTDDLQDLYQNIHAILGNALDATNFFISLVNEEEDKLDFPYFTDERDQVYEITGLSDPKTVGLSIHIIRTGKPLFLSASSPANDEVQKMCGIVGTPAAAWLGVPLKLGKRIIGTMTVQSYTNSNQYTHGDMALMKAVSEQVALAIERKANEEELTALNEELEYKVALRTAELSTKAHELEAANIRLKELDEIKSSLVSSVSHELRTPLTSIRGFAKLAGKAFFRYFYDLADSPELEGKGDRIRKNLEIIEDEGERLTRLINDFLDINRIETGNATWNDSNLNPCEVIRHAAIALTGAFEAKEGVNLVVDLPDSVPPIHADPDKIQQVVINLLNNASKFTHEGEVRITACAAGTKLVVSVTDSGMGIPADEQARIFDKFHKSHTGDTVPHTAKGTGLGLAICREIVEHYGGSIWVESTPGKGSTFSFSLPVLPGSEKACIQ